MPSRVLPALLRRQRLRDSEQALRMAVLVDAVRLVVETPAQVWSGSHDPRRAYRERREAAQWLLADGDHPFGCQAICDIVGIVRPALLKAIRAEVDIGAIAKGGK